MASRSFKPSYLASATSGRSRNCSPRPPFTRTDSSSSNISTKSDDSFVRELKALGMLDRENESNGDNFFKGDGDGVRHSDAKNTPTAPPTPSRKRSQPIAIEAPSRVAKVYTPLSARGDLPGGYFPNHEVSANTSKPYQPHPFAASQSVFDSFATSSAFDAAMTSSSPYSPSDTTPKMISSIASPAFVSPTSPSVPAPLLVPTGKYHPANYKSPASTSVSTPISMPSSSRGAPLPPTSLTIPSSSSKRAGRDRTGHERNNSDVKRKIQQYQREMIAQAQFAASTSMSKGSNLKAKPISPRLLPAGSPGPITPFELEGEDDGYIVAGGRARGNSLIGNGLDKERERQARRVHAAATQGPEMSSTARV